MSTNAQKARVLISSAIDASRRRGATELEIAALLITAAVAVSTGKPLNAVAPMDPSDLARVAESITRAHGQAGQMLTLVNPKGSA